ncbi:MAG TPA: c-type cytochrome [Pseudoduganella sp.]
MKTMKHCTLPLTIAALAAAAPAWAQNVSAGKAVFAQCAACHAISATHGVGPGLANVLGRKAGSAAGFRYSPAMKRTALTWDAKTLDSYLRDPQAAVPGNTMPFSGLGDDKQRADLIAYLATLQ